MNGSGTVKKHWGAVVVPGGVPPGNRRKRNIPDGPVHGDDDDDDDDGLVDDDDATLTAGMLNAEVEQLRKKVVSNKEFNAFKDDVRRQAGDR